MREILRVMRDLGVAFAQNVGNLYSPGIRLPLGQNNAWLVVGMYHERGIGRDDATQSGQYRTEVGPGRYKWYQSIPHRVRCVDEDVDSLGGKDKDLIHPVRFINTELHIRVETLFSNQEIGFILRNEILSKQIRTSIKKALSLSSLTQVLTSLTLAPSLSSLTQAIPKFIKLLGLLRPRYSGPCFSYRLLTSAFNNRVFCIMSAPYD
ncbi:hypothetical protein LguiB_020492 [Lonicera macranthoides]